MTHEPFTHAVANPQTRGLIAEQIASGVDPVEVAARYGISATTARRYAVEFEGARRRVAALQPDEVAAIRDGVARGSRRRWERQHGAEVVRQVLGE
ncbi:helix-turn-helix domain-containing protein [Mycolicibacterium senegalense]|uniref:helix-turn-helix domain-containing protein n=1 Tax=Mycolicibacterium senegalense TaxID=1796 RepID=UPI003AABAA0B